LVQLEVPVLEKQKKKKPNDTTKLTQTPLRRTLVCDLTRRTQDEVLKQKVRSNGGREELMSRKERRGKRSSIPDVGRFGSGNNARCKGDACASEVRRSVCFERKVMDSGFFYAANPGYSVIHQNQYIRQGQNKESNWTGEEKKGVVNFDPGKNEERERRQLMSLALRKSPLVFFPGDWTASDKRERRKDFKKGP